VGESRQLGNSVARRLQWEPSCRSRTPYRVAPGPPPTEVRPSALPQEATTKPADSLSQGL